MKDKLLIVTKIKRTIEYVDKHLDNYPHRYIELKKRIIDDMYSILEYVYLANVDLFRYNNQSMWIVKIQLIDYYLKLSYKKDIISKKNYESLSKHLLEVSKMIFTWRDNEASK